MRNKIKKILKPYKKGRGGIRKYLEGIFFQSRLDSVKKRNLYFKYFKDKKGIEIGGPSAIFKKEIPIYEIAEELDCCNFSNNTIWEGQINEGENYNFYKDKIGRQYICEANNLNEINNEKYDFLIASHCLEHCANTLKTIYEWLRVLKKGGAILLILPDKRYTFDHNRSITTFDHLVEDFNKDVDERDLTHLTEILELHDLSLDIPAGTKEQFKNRSLENFRNRCLHHHVFDFKLLIAVYAHVNVKVIYTAFIKPYHQVILGIKQ